MKKLILMFLSGMGCMSLINEFRKEPVIEKEIIEVREVVQVCDSTAFTPARLIEEIDKYNFRFPHLVFAQAIEETRFNSNAFRNYNNLFGMGVAGSRITTAIKQGRTYLAKYPHWTYSVVDRAIYEAVHLNKLKTEDEYLNYLNANYAESNEYKTKIKNLAKNYEKIKKGKGAN